MNSWTSFCQEVIMVNFIVKIFNFLHFLDTNSSFLFTFFCHIMFYPPVLMQSIYVDITKESQSIQKAEIMMFFRVAKFVLAFQHQKILISKVRKIQKKVLIIVYWLAISFQFSWCLHYICWYKFELSQFCSTCNNRTNQNNQILIKYIIEKMQKIIRDLQTSYS